MSAVRYRYVVLDSLPQVPSTVALDGSEHAETQSMGQLALLAEGLSEMRI